MRDGIYAVSISSRLSGSCSVTAAAAALHLILDQLDLGTGLDGCNNVALLLLILSSVATSSERHLHLQIIENSTHC